MMKVTANAVRHTHGAKYGNWRLPFFVCVYATSCISFQSLMLLPFCYPCYQQYQNHCYTAHNENRYVTQPSADYLLLAICLLLSASLYSRHEVQLQFPPLLLLAPPLCEAPCVSVPQTLLLLLAFRLLLSRLVLLRLMPHSRQCCLPLNALCLPHHIHTPCAFSRSTRSLTLRTRSALCSGVSLARAFCLR